MQTAAAEEEKSKTEEEKKRVEVTNMRRALEEQERVLADMTRTRQEKTSASTEATQAFHSVATKKREADGAGEALKKARAFQGEKKHALDQAKEEKKREEDSNSAKRVKIASILDDPDLAAPAIQLAAKAELEKLTEMRLACERAVEAAVEDEGQAAHNMQACEAKWQAIFE